MATTIQHDLPTLQADIIGELVNDASLAVFRGIPYASVERRWTHSRIQHQLPSTFDATRFGPRCVQKHGHVLVTGGESDPTPGDDEFKCLNLNITVPKTALFAHSTSDTGRPLPVLVWIHGGGFSFGANSVARYRSSKLSSLALKAGTPVVLVQIQYRLGVLGFAASNDLASEQAVGSINGKNQDINITSSLAGSYGFIDQRNALAWVRDHIADFGGDPLNVTAFGVSAGSASIHYHILSGDPLFDRAILMSGAAPVLGPLPFERYETAWQKLCSRAGIDGATPAQRLDQLRRLSPEELLENYIESPMGRWQMDDCFPCRDTPVEGIILDALIESTPQSRFQELYKSALSDSKGFAASFGFTSENLPHEEYRDKMRYLISVAMFHYSTLAIAESFYPAGDAFLYHLEEPSPYPGPTFGHSYHGLCALYVYQNHCDEYPLETRQIAEKMGHVWTAFAHGKQPWQPYHKCKQFMRLGPQGKCSMEDLKSDKTRNYQYLPWVRTNFEELRLFTQRLLQKTL